MHSFSLRIVDPSVLGIDFLLLILFVTSCCYLTTVGQRCLNHTGFLRRIDVLELLDVHCCLSLSGFVVIVFSQLNRKTDIFDMLHCSCLSRAEEPGIFPKSVSNFEVITSNSSLFADDDAVM